MPSGTGSVLHTLRRHLALRVLIVRAFLTTIVVQLLVGIAGALARSSFANPIGVVILVSVIGALDYRRRSESSLWGNLGYGSWVHPAIYGMVALSSAAAVTLIRMAVR